MKVLDYDKLEEVIRARFTRARDIGPSFGLKRAEVNIAPRDLLGWLRGQNNTARAYWQSRDGSLEIAAVGRAWEANSRNSSSLPDTLDAVRVRDCVAEAADGIRVWGGMAFDSSLSVSDVWHELGAFYFWVPRFEIIRQNDNWSLAVNGRFEDLPECIASYRALEWADPSSVPLPAARILSKVPEESTWRQRVSALTGSLGDVLDKLVLASCCHLQLDRSTDPFSLLQSLRRHDRGSYDFVIQRGDSAFLGRSPETLYKREGRQVTTEALAGTQAGGAAQALRESQKEILEHDYVIRDIEIALQALCRDIHRESSRDVVSWGTLQHLCTRFRATLPEDKHDGDLLASLHPSAAVLGFPRNAAWRELKQTESLARGWYAGPVGWIAKDAAEFAVGIRSALLRDRDLYVYAGAGIVKGSDPAREWQELQEKMKPFLTTLGIIP